MKKKEILIVTADYYKEIADNLFNGAIDYLEKEIKKLSKLLRKREVEQSF